MGPPNATPTEAFALTREDQARLAMLRAQSPASQAPPQPPSLGARIADWVAKLVGSWRFIILQSIVLAAWLLGNSLAGSNSWDPYPFILLNLLLSFQAAYSAPIIMMSQNRQSEIDRRNAETDYRVNEKAELEIEFLHAKIDALRAEEIQRLTAIIERLTEHLAPGEAKRILATGPLPGSDRQASTGR